MGIPSSNRLPERNRPLITPDNRFVKRYKTNATSIDNRCDHRTNKCWKESRLTAINMWMLGNSSEIARRYMSKKNILDKKRYITKKIQEEKNTSLKFPRCRVLCISQFFIRHSRCLLHLLGVSGHNPCLQITEEKSTGPRYIDHKCSNRKI